MSLHVPVLFVLSVCHERGFSSMNLVKNKYRLSLQEENTRDLLMRNMNGP